MEARGRRSWTDVPIESGDRSPAAVGSVAASVATHRVGPPHVADHVVLRARALESLASAVGTVAAVAAPAGYGKTSHVAAWARRDGRPVAWFELEELDNDPQLLVERLVELLLTVTDIDPAQVPRSPSSTAQFETIVAPALAAAIRRCTEPFILVLDDVHRVEFDGALAVIGALSSNVPTASTVVLVGRDAPRTPSAAVRMTPGYVEVGTVDLALDVADVRTVLDDVGVSLDDDEIVRLVDETEGWPVGVRFAGFAARRAAGVDASVDVGDLLGDRDVREYVREEWLRRLSADDVEFLRQVSGLGWLSGALADHALQRSDSGAMLARLASSPLVVVPLDRRGTSYRLHHLVAEVLDEDFERVARDARRAIATRASEWFERAGEIDRAVLHALRAADVDRTAQLVARHGSALHTLGRHHTVDRWLASLPREIVLSNASLCLVSAVTSVAMGDGEAALIWLRFGEQAETESADGADSLQLEMVALRSVLVSSDIEAPLRDAQRAYAGLPAGLWHAVACFSIGLMQSVLGDDRVALAVLDEGATEARLVRAATIEAQCGAARAAVYAYAADWKRADAAARESRRLVNDNGLEHLPTLVLATAMNAWTRARAGDPETARADILLSRRNLAYVDKLTSWATIHARLALAHASLLLDDRVGAKTFVEEASAALDTVTEAGRLPELIADLEHLLNAARHDQLGPSSLTTAELRVLHYLPTNLSLGEIGQRLYVSRNTAKSHAAAVYRKLDVSSRSEAVERARESGLLPET